MGIILPKWRQNVKFGWLTMAGRVRKSRESHTTLTMPLTADTLPVMSESAKKPFVILTYAVLILSVLLVFWQVHNFDFINYDDNAYIYENPHVFDGLTRDGIVWAFTAAHSYNWHPLTWLSHMLDCQLFGPKPGRMHLVNVLLHLANTLLLFALLKKMTGSLWPSTFVAAAFALHPMHVESVAWIAERKDVLSTLFLLLTLAAYVSYVRCRGTSRYLLTVLLFALGLMAKPMLVTLPFVMLLLDYWPLGRIDARRTLYRALVEKIPFFALAAASSVITYFAQHSGGSVIRMDALPPVYRAANAFLSYARYIGRMFWPQDLALFYPFDAHTIGYRWIAISILVMIVVSILVILFGRKQKYLAVGWFWFVGTLVPVIGVVQVGSQAFADRYTYVPYIGLFVMIAWGLPELLSGLPYRKFVLGISATVALASLGICARQQVSYWKDSVTLFSHTLDVTQNNDLVHNNRGIAYEKIGRRQESIEDFREAVRINPDNAEAYNNLGVAYGKLGRHEDSVDAQKKAVKIMPDIAEIRYNLANELKLLGRLDEAVDQYRQAMRLKVDWPEPMSNLAWLIATCPGVKDRNTNEAIRLAIRACELTNYRNPAFSGILSAAYASAGRFSEAVDTAKRAMDLADATNQPQIRDIIRRHLSLYEQGKPYIEPPVKPTPDPNKP
jgi:tetratricopeptide (TPR) repeat protein